MTLIGDVDATDAIAGLDQSTGYAVTVAGRKFWHWNGTTLITRRQETCQTRRPLPIFSGYVIVSDYGTRCLMVSAGGSHDMEPDWTSQAQKSPRPDYPG